LEARKIGKKKIFGKRKRERKKGKKNKEVVKHEKYYHNLLVELEIKIQK